MSSFDVSLPFEARFTLRGSDVVPDPLTMAVAHQVHGDRVAWVAAPGLVPATDGLITATDGLTLGIKVADCAAILFCDPIAGVIAAVHAGWRGLGAGVIEAAVERVAAAAACGAHRLVAWLGPCIGPARFEVGPEVVDALGGGPAFRPSAGSSRPDRCLADLPMLARERLRRLGIERVAGGTECTATLPQRYYSHRRDGITGRMAAAVWLKR
jgi:YfiH family protein